MKIREYGVMMILAALLTGGCQRSTTTVHSPAPKMTKQGIFADCTARYFRGDKTTYITRQTHQFDAKERFFAMTAKEPTGPIQYSLSAGIFESPTPYDRDLSDLPREFCTPMLATGIFYSFCAGSGLLDLSQMPILESMKLEGRWYQPIRIDESINNNFTVTAFLALDTQRVELVSVLDMHGTEWLFRSYNLRYSMKLDKMLPRAIDVFDVRQGLASKQFIAQFQYEDIQNTISTPMSKTDK